MSKEKSLYPRNFPDRLFRDVLVHPKNLEALLRRTTPEVADRLDYSRMAELPRSYTVDDWRERDLDLLLSLPYRDEAGEILVCVQIEHQSSPEQVMPLRMLLHSVLHWEKQWHTWKQDHDYAKPLELTLVIPIVFYTGLDPWNANKEFGDLFKVPEVLREFIPQWKMELWPLNENTPEALLQASESFWHAMAVVRASRQLTKEYLEVVREAFTRLLPVGLADTMYWHELAKLVVSWSIGRRPQAEHKTIRELAHQHHKGTTLQDEVDEMTEAAFKTWEEELAERLKEKFKAEGEAEGLRTCRSTLHIQLEQKFGALPEDISQQIERADLAQLEAALAKVMSIQNLEDLDL